MQTTDEQAHTLYSHSRRPTWGLAILAVEGLEERQYQFQDGQLRTFKRGYYELLEEVDAPPPRALDIVRDLRAMLRIERGRREPGPTPKSVERAISWSDQLRLFEALYPRTFADPLWMSKVRGATDGRRLKRHRVAAIEQAQAVLAAGELERALAEGAHRGVLDGVKRVLAATDLAGSKDTAAIRRLPKEESEAFVRALHALLFGAGPYGPRFDAYVAMLRRASGERVSWPLATVLCALVHPSEHVAVKPSVFRQQAQWMAPSLVYDANPSSGLYQKLLAMTHAVRDRIAQAGHEPRDLLDVYDFMLTTLRPRALAKLAALDRTAD